MRLKLAARELIVVFASAVNAYAQVETSKTTPVGKDGNLSASDHCYDHASGSGACRTRCPGWRKV